MYSADNIIKKDSIIFMLYSGYFSQDIIKGLVSALEKQTDDIKLSITIAKKLYIVFIELSQNLMKYCKKDYIGNNDSELILIQQNKESYFVTSRNIVDNKVLNSIKITLDELAKASKDEIKKQYNALRKSDENTHSNGSGIGFYQLARKSDGVEYIIDNVKEDSSRLAITIRIDKNK